MIGLMLRYDMVVKVVSCQLSHMFNIKNKLIVNLCTQGINELSMKGLSYLRHVFNSIKISQN